MTTYNATPGLIKEIESPEMIQQLKAKISHLGKEIFKRLNIKAQFVSFEKLEMSSGSKAELKDLFKHARAINPIKLPIGMGLFFAVALEPGADLGPEHHDCFEVFQVVSGKFLNVANMQILGPGSIIVIEPNEKHHFKAITAGLVYQHYTHERPYYHKSKA